MVVLSSPTNRRPRMASVSGVLARIKQDLHPFIPEESIVSACRSAGHRWRERKLGPVRTLHLFVTQVLCLNTAMTHLRHLGKTALKAPAYCKARMRLPLKVLQTLLQESATAMQEACGSPGALWCGLRTYLVDGSSTIVPDTPTSQKAFGQPKGCKEGLRVSRAQGPGPLRRVHRADAPDAVLRPVHPRAVQGLDAAPAAQGGRTAGGRPRVLLVRAPGDAVFPRDSRAFPRAPEADRGLPPAPQVPQE